MKPNKLICGGKDSCVCSVRVFLDKYGDMDCVVAYYKSNFGNVGIIKRTRSYFAFYSVNRIIANGFYQSILTRSIELENAVNLMGDKVIVLDKGEFSKVKKQIILNKLK